MPFKEKLLTGVPQGSILGPLLFNIGICNLFFIIEDCDIANYAADNTSYLSGKNVEEVLKGLENVSPNLFQWFTENELKGTASKCHLLISSNENMHVNIGTSQIKNSDCERLLRIDIYCKLSFENHINQICSKFASHIIIHKNSENCPNSVNFAYFRGMEIVSKQTVSAECRASRHKPCGNWAFTQNFQNKK